MLMKRRMVAVLSRAKEAWSTLMFFVRLPSSVLQEEGCPSGTGAWPGWPDQQTPEENDTRRTQP